MPAKKKTARKAAKRAAKPAKSFEETLWDTANTAMLGCAGSESEGTQQSVPEGQDKLRGSVESSDWSGATKATRQGCPEGERGGAKQYKQTAKRGSVFSNRRWRRRTPRVVRGAEDNVLSLIFLKFVSDKFEERRADLHVSEAISLALARRTEPRPRQVPSSWNVRKLGLTPLTQKLGLTPLTHQVGQGGEYGGR